MRGPLRSQHEPHRPDDVAHPHPPAGAGTRCPRDGGRGRSATGPRAAATALAAAPATRLDELRLAAREDLCEAELARGVGAREAAAVLPELAALAAEQPLRERPLALLMRARHAAGRPAEALAAYRDYRARLADELGVDPSPALAELHLAVLRGELRPPPGAPAGDVPPAPAPPPPGNLRAALTSFVGRDEELRLIGKRLAEARLVTLVGPGGSGKTRLASTAAADLVGHYPGGVWLVELASVSDPDDVPRAVLAALGRRVSGLLDRPRQPGGPGPNAPDALGRVVGSSR
ncbi:BTAD domain-containing putative transcriptional regulator [Streptomyces sp. B6B3]|uniref:BTAD domain-containing putative transcriptional regulator n=1 Tax=Streptomyces sp. B6B3 TaxID=3153570 RepID=UPI00325EA912